MGYNQQILNCGLNAYLFCGFDVKNQKVITDTVILGQKIGSEVITTFVNTVNTDWLKQALHLYRGRGTRNRTETTSSQTTRTTTILYPDIQKWCYLNSDGQNN